MALIKKSNIVREDKERNNVHSEVPVSYTVFEDNGKKYFQIDTFGKSTRQHPEKISQSLQFDQETAKFIIQLIVDELL